MKLLLVIFSLIILFSCGSETDDKPLENEPATVLQYEKAIDVKEWCAGYPPKVDLGYYVRLSQIVSGFAIFRGKGELIVIPVSQLPSPLNQNTPIENIVRFIGFKGKSKFENRNGFPVELDVYDVISLSEFKEAKVKYGKSHGFSVERCQPFETSLL